MSKADVNKIVELILSDDETNQELGMMMAVSQGVKQKVARNLYNEILDLIRLNTGHTKNNILSFYTETESTSSYTSYWLCIEVYSNSRVIKIGNRKIISIVKYYENLEKL